MQLKKTQPIVLSITLHTGIIILLVSQALSEQKRATVQKPITSYLLFHVPQPEVKTVETAPQIVQKKSAVEFVKAVQAPVLEIQQGVMPIEALADTPMEIQLTDDPIIESKTGSTSRQRNASTSSVLTNSVTFIEAFNATELGKLSRDASVEYRRPKPLIDKTKPERNHRELKALSADFAPKGMDIMVLGEFGPNETTIMLGDSCFTVIETDLLDHITRGATVWRRGNPACRKYDKFDGQLQKSLDKFLKK